MATTKMVKPAFILPYVGWGFGRLMPAGFTAIRVVANMGAVGRLIGIKIKPLTPDMFIF
jgi:hypothetical protein